MKNMVKNEIVLLDPYSEALCHPPPPFTCNCFDLHYYLPYDVQWGGGGFFFDLKNFIANLVLVEPELWSLIPEKFLNKFSQKSGGGWFKVCSEFVKKIINFGRQRRPV